MLTSIATEPPIFSQSAGIQRLYRGYAVRWKQDPSRLRDLTSGPRDKPVKLRAIEFAKCHHLACVVADCVLSKWDGLSGQTILDPLVYRLPVF